VSAKLNHIDVACGQLGPQAAAVEAAGMLSLYTFSGVTVVLKFLKFQNCPEITDCPEILGIW